jgi:hypothetical protein
LNSCLNYINLFSLFDRIGLTLDDLFVKKALLQLQAAKFHSVLLQKVTGREGTGRIPADLIASCPAGTWLYNTLEELDWKLMQLGEEDLDSIAAKTAKVYMDTGSYAVAARITGLYTL